MNNQTPTRATPSPKGVQPKQAPQSGRTVMVTLLICAIVALVVVALIALYRGKREKAFQQFVAEKQSEHQKAFAEYIKTNAAPTPTEEQSEEFIANVESSTVGSPDGDAFVESIQRAEKSREEANREEFRNR